MDHVSARNKRSKFAPAVTLVEVMVTMVIVLVAVLGTSSFRYHSTMAIRKAEVQLTATRLASLLLYGWKGSGGHSGYSIYELSDPDDYDPSDPNDYDPTDVDSVQIASGLEVSYGAPGPPIPDGYNALDSDANPNYRIVVDGVNYYATLSYKDVVDEPRELHVCVAWMNDYQVWSESEPYRSVTLTTYADD